MPSRTVTWKASPQPSRSLWPTRLTLRASWVVIGTPRLGRRARQRILYTAPADPHAAGALLIRWLRAMSIVHPAARRARFPYHGTLDRVRSPAMLPDATYRLYWR